MPPLHSKNIQDASDIFRQNSSCNRIVRIKECSMKHAALLILLLVFAQSPLRAATEEKPIPYGNNPAAGHFLQVGDAKIYYEIYGSGRPLVLLHGGVLGYIDEYAGIIPEMSKHYTVIAIAFRGHGKSELGNQPLSNALFASDSFAVIRHVTSEPFDLVGFSTGAMVSYLLTIDHPDLVHRLIAVGGPISESGEVESGGTVTDEDVKNAPAELEKLFPLVVARRKKLYADPHDWDLLAMAFARMNQKNQDVPKEKIQAIQSPTLIAAGDRDMITKTEHFVEIYHLLPHSELAIIPGCGHTVFKCNPNLMLELVSHFLLQEEVPAAAR
jgi:pimeloyl-ACP methyl ester carboxylesterase